MSDDKKQRWWKRHPVVSIILLIISAIIVLFCAFLLFLHIFFGPRTEPAGMAEVSRWQHVKFPPNAKLQHSVGIRHFIDYELYAEIEIDRKDVEAIVDELKKEPYLLSRKDRMNITNSLRNWREDMPVPKWWKPDSAKKFIASETGLLISLDGSGKVTVWVHFDTDRPFTSDRFTPTSPKTPRSSP